jgi:hypothetical protein
MVRANEQELAQYQNEKENQKFKENISNFGKLQGMTHGGR